MTQIFTLRSKRVSPEGIKAGAAAVDGAAVLEVGAVGVLAEEVVDEAGVTNTGEDTGEGGVVSSLTKYMWETVDVRFVLSFSLVRESKLRRWHSNSIIIDNYILQTLPLYRLLTPKGISALSLKTFFPSVVSLAVPTIVLHPRSFDITQQLGLAIFEAFSQHMCKTLPKAEDHSSHSCTINVPPPSSHMVSVSFVDSVWDKEWSLAEVMGFLLFFSLGLSNTVVLLP
jgi:hypothetical protein